MNQSALVHVSEVRTCETSVEWDYLTIPDFHLGGGVSHLQPCWQRCRVGGWMARTGAAASTAGPPVSDRGATVLNVAEVAIGLRDHSGWAVAVTLSAEPLVRDRRRIELCDPALPRQAFHAASGLPLEQASQVIKQVRQSAMAASERELRRLADDLARQGHHVQAVAISIPTSSIPDDLSTVLRSHLLLHAAEGELYSEALAVAAHATGLPTVRYTTKAVVAEAAGAIDCSPATVVEIAAKLGHGLGPPWAKDQKDAATAALLALHTVG